MIGRTAQRVVVITAAAAAVLWLAHGLRALSLDAQGRDKVRAAGSRPSAAQVASAVTLFKRAARLNADPAPDLDRATLYLRLGRERQAAALLEGIVAANAGNVRAWTLLSTATARINPRRSTQASRVLRGLFGLPAGFVSQQEPILATSQRVFRIVPDAVQGRVEGTEAAGSAVFFTGWAGSLRDRRPASSILIFSDGRLVAEGAASLPRPDISRTEHVPLGRSGFVIAVPLARLEAGDRKPQVLVFGISGQAASSLPYYCGRQQRYGCAG